MIKETSIRFSNHLGDQISGTLDLPLAMAPRAMAIFAHCFSCHGNRLAAKQIRKALTKKGIGVLCFDFSGLVNSPVRDELNAFPDILDDLVAAAKYLEREHLSPRLLIGHSLGGASLLSVAKRIESVQAVATISAPGETKKVQQLFTTQLSKIIEMSDNGHGNEEGKSGQEAVLPGLENVDLSSTVQKLDKALLVMHSPQDRVVPIEEAAKIYRAAHHPKSFVSLDGADHLLSDKNDSYYVGQVIAAWASRYIEFAPDAYEKPDSQVFVRLNHADKYTCDIRARNHQLMGDEPTDIGGADAGPTPYELLQSALGACTAITLQMYASRKKWPLEEVRVKLNFNKRHSKDVEKTQDPRAFIHAFEILLEFDGDLTEEQKDRLVQIANKCPVHRTLIQEKELSVRLSP